MPKRGNTKVSLSPERFRAYADTLQVQIEEKRHPAVSNQNQTARRARIAQGMAQDADRLERIQSALRKLADVAESSDGLPRYLSGLTTKAQVEDILSWERMPGETGYANAHKRLAKGGITNAEEFNAAKKFLSTPKREKTKAEIVRDAERELIGVKLDGFFPTPRPLIDELLSFAHILPGMRVLEPSAGKGDIADAIKERHPDVRVDVCEIQDRLALLLVLKGYAPIGRNFLELKLGVNAASYDRIVMNPPFERGQDIEHIQHAYSLLGSGGKLVSIASEGPFFRNDKKAQTFRTWLALTGAESFKVDSGAFQGKDSFRQTGVSTRIVVIERA